MDLGGRDTGQCCRTSSSLIFGLEAEELNQKINPETSLEKRLSLRVSLEGERPRLCGSVCDPESKLGLLCEEGIDLAGHKANSHERLQFRDCAPQMFIWTLLVCRSAIPASEFIGIVATLPPDLQIRCVLAIGLPV